MTLACSTKLTSDHSASAQNLKTGQVVIVIVFVDNFLFFWPDIAGMNSIKRFFSKTYNMKNSELFGYFTGIKIKRQTEGNNISFSTGDLCSENS